MQRKWLIRATRRTPAKIELPHLVCKLQNEHVQSRYDCALCGIFNQSHNKLFDEIEIKLRLARHSIKTGEFAFKGGTHFVYCALRDFILRFEQKEFGPRSALSRGRVSCSLGLPHIF